MTPQIITPKACSPGLVRCENMSEFTSASVGAKANAYRPITTNRARNVVFRAASSSSRPPTRCAPARNHWVGTHRSTTTPPMSGDTMHPRYTVP
jgi:hypothetical protein